MVVTMPTRGTSPSLRSGSRDEVSSPGRSPGEVPAGAAKKHASVRYWGALNLRWVTASIFLTLRRREYT
jgi:hypothetical protein